MESELKALIALQYELKKGHQHLVRLTPEHFWMAHTDEERASDDHLEDCPFHLWLLSFASAPADPGIYVMHDIDDLEPLNASGLANE